MSAKLRVGARIRARLRGEVRVYGLRAPAVIRGGDEMEVSLEDAADTHIVAGFVAAERDMLAIDLERRLWSGRLAAMGAGPIGALPAADLDIFVRLLGLRADAEKRARGLSAQDRSALDTIAAGMNAWTDAGRWEGEERWSQLTTRPRLMGPADILLLSSARTRAARLPTQVPTPPAGWPEPWTAGLQTRLDAVAAALTHPLGRGSQSVDALWAVQASGQGGAPSLHAERVLPGGDGHRVTAGDGWVRMSVRRPDIAVRGESARRPWLRRSPRGPLVSDVLAGAESTAPPTGLGFSFAWEGPTREVPPRAAASRLIKTVRLVPLVDGA